LKVVTPGFSDESRSLAKKYGYDEWLVSRFLAYVPEVEKFMEKMEKPPTRYIRANTLKTSPSELKARLEAKGFSLTQTPLPEVFAVLREPMSAGATAEYMLGHYYVQDLSSCIAVDALDASEGHDVLEVAAAPGGKTTMIAQRMNNTGSIVALEPNPRRARSMSFNLARCGVINTAVMQSDGRDAGKMGLRFDRVLLDAPCSCEGVIAKDETRKTSHEPSDVEMCSTLQESLIEAAAAAVRPGGILVYSTCSFAPEENEAVLDSLIQKRDDVSVEPIGFGSAGIARFQNIEFSDQVTNARRLYPHLHDTTGFFIAKVRVG
jgi:NOL1/NOP2/sun family putative RNA methylase